MDVFKWVVSTAKELRNSGHERLAEILLKAPGLADHATRAQLEAMVQEGVALARALDHPWIEVYLRHWLAQAVVLIGYDVSAGLDDLIRLLDLAHTERARDCPQSICVCQDVCAAYSITDGPGYAEERLRATEETLARIDPTWPCFDCISVERAWALIDAQRYPEAEAFCRQQQSALRAARQRTSHQLRRYLCAIYSQRGEHAKALKALGRAPPGHEAPNGHRRHRLHQCRELALLGRAQEAHEHFIAANELAPSDYLDWAGAAKALCAAGRLPNDRQLGITLRGFVRQLRAHGARYIVAELALIGAQLALDRGSPAVAELNLQEAQSMVALLRKPQQIVSEIARLRGLLPAPGPANRLPPGAVMDALCNDPERDLLALLPAIEQHRDDATLVEATCRAYLALDFPELANQRLRQFIDRHPHAVQCAELLLQSLLDAADAAALAELLASSSPELRPRVMFYRAQLFERRGQWAQCAAALQQAIAVQPTIDSYQRLLALAYLRLERWQDSLELLNALVRDPANAQDHWNRMVAAAALGEFSTLQASASSLGFELAADGSSAAFSAECKILSRDQQGRELRLPAQRVGPVLARMIAVSAPGIEPNLSDEVLIDPIAVRGSNPDAATDEEQPIDAYQALKILRRGGYRSYELDGIRPPEEQVEALKAALGKSGARLVVDRSVRLRILPPAGEELVPGFVALIAVPAELPTAAVHSMLCEHLDQWPAPVTYCELLRELQLHEKLQQHEALAETMQW